MKGSGQVSAVSSGKFKDLPVSWSARTEGSSSLTTPEELLAAAHASCFCMALSNGLAKSGHPATRLEATATVTFDRVGDGWGVTASEIDVRGTVPGIDDAAFRQAAEAAKDGCPISRALKGNIELAVKATLVA
jgi:osmotically inducible protein OsmC